MLIALRNKQVLALMLIALVSFMIIVAIVASFVFKFDLLHIFSGRTITIRYS